MGLGWRQKVKDKLDSPIIVVDQIKNAWRITHLDETAQSTGLCHGQSLSDARAICPQVEVIYEERERDQLLLEAIADWCDRYTPLVALDAPDGMMLDITGCAHLFDGEEVLANDLLVRLFHQGFAVSGAISSTPGAAWAASRFGAAATNVGEKKTVTMVAIQPRKEEEALVILPLAGLRLDSETLGGLARLGLRTIGQVMARPRAPLTRRFGKLLMLRLDQALGESDEAISPRLPVPELMAERCLVEPIGRVQDIEILIEKLAICLCEDLEKRGMGARKIDLALFRIDGKTVRLHVGTSSPLNDAASVGRLFKERIAALADDFDAGLGFEIGRLSALETEPYIHDQTSLLAGQKNEAKELSHLIDKLSARLGTASIQCLVPGETHLPENVDRETVIVASRTEVEAKNFSHAVRPLRLFRYPEPVEAIAAVPEGPPVRFRWRRKLHVVVHVEGPERIGDEWWGTHKLRDTRDYFRVEDESGFRYWLYRQGLYASETNSPNWYMHGIFA